MAEVGGGRKKKVPPVLDWDKLMSPGNDDDDEPPPLKVIPAAETPKPRSSAIYDEEETSDRDITQRQIPCKDLRDSIARMRRMDSSTTFLLTDGGAKLRALLTCHEKEFKRRNLQKDDEKCKDTSSVDELTCIDAKDGISPGTSSSRPASKSTFAKCLIEKLGDKISIGETESFKEEIATLKQCDSKNTSANRQSRFWNAQRIEFPSRQTPFKSPGYLSVKINKQTQSNVDEEELETDVIDQVDQSIRDTNIYYPSRVDLKAIEIRYSDMRCFDS